MDTTLFNYESDLIPNAGLPDEMAKRLVSKRADIDKMTPFDADVYARNVMAGVNSSLWLAMTETNKKVRHCGFGHTEAMIDLANNILSYAEYAFGRKGQYEALGIVGKTVYITENGIYDKPPKNPAIKKLTKKTTPKSKKAANKK